jgi:hypothetical protein
MSEDAIDALTDTRAEIKRLRVERDRREQLLWDCLAALDLIEILRRKTLGRDKGDLLCLAGTIARQRADRIRAELTGGGGVQQAVANEPTTYD